MIKWIQSLLYALSSSAAGFVPRVPAGTRQTLSATRDRKETEWRMRMFREMRRKKQRLSAEACEAILAEGTSGVLAVDGDGGYPYAVPLSYVYQDGKLFFHCAKSGHQAGTPSEETLGPLSV